MFHAIDAGELRTVALHGPDSLTAAEDERSYQEHNVTFEHTRRLEGGGVLTARPNEHSAQCQCARCCGHRRRACRTKTADKGKNVHA